ncbi:MAG: response regulator [Candidatus Schekmanbacteria bacterium]|nr:response regulator [Candidatus Schekmanbacteria bacterium]
MSEHGIAAGRPERELDELRACNVQLEQQVADLSSAVAALRAPATAVLDITQRLLQTPSVHLARERLTMLAAASEHLLALLGEIPAATSAGAGTQAIQTPVAAEGGAGVRPSASSLPYAPRILVAEDNPTGRFLVESALRKLGCEVTGAADGRQALELVACAAFDAILMDCEMPELDGYEATARIRGREGEFRHTPIIALVAHTHPFDRDRCLVAGMDDYLHTPIELGALRALLSRWVGGYCGV